MLTRAASQPGRPEGAQIPIRDVHRRQVLAVRVVDARRQRPDALVVHPRVLQTQDPAPTSKNTRGL